MTINHPQENCSKILLTGNLGYIGSVMVPLLKKLNYSVIGLDTNFYDSDCQLYPVIAKPNFQVIKDIRDIEKENLSDIDAVIHLAALSNDPLGDLNPEITYEINYQATLRLSEMAKQCGVKRFVYASSQSMYGISKTDDELDEDNSVKNPITAYAKAKWMAECELKKMGDDNFIISCFRPSTVFGSSPKLRCDIVYNNLIACAYTTGKIEIRSDGSPFRPVVHVEDVSKAFISGIRASKELIANQSFNVGIPNGNFTVKELADAAGSVVKNSTITFTNEHGSDARTYQVCFNKILTQLKDYFKPDWNLINGGQELVSTFTTVGLTESDFRGEKTIRLMRLKNLISNNRLSPDLKWIK